MGKGSAGASIQAVKASIREAIVKLTDDRGLERKRDLEAPAPLAAAPLPAAPPAARAARAGKPKSPRLVS